MASVNARKSAEARDASIVVRRTRGANRPIAARAMSGVCVCTIQAAYRRALAAM
jgi:hypothetical protein